MKIKSESLSPGKCFPNIVLPCWRARKLPPPWEQSLCTLTKTCAENSNPQGDSKGKQDLWESNQLPQSAFPAGLRQFLPIPCVKSVQGSRAVSWHSIHGVGSTLQDFPFFPIITSQHPKSLWSLNQKQKQGDFPAPPAPLHEPGVRNSSGGSLPSEKIHICRKVSDFTSLRAGPGDLCAAFIVC